MMRDQQVQLLDAVREIVEQAECCEKEICGPPEPYRCVVCRLRELIGAPRPAVPPCPVTQQHCTDPLCAAACRRLEPGYQEALHRPAGGPPPVRD